MKRPAAAPSTHERVRKRPAAASGPAAEAQDAPLMKRPAAAVRKRPAASVEAVAEIPDAIAVVAGTSNFEILQREIVKRSTSTNWAEAKPEWALTCVYWKKSGGQCLCTHKPIKEICVLKNQSSGKDAIVGNCCVKRFMEDINSEIIFAAVRRVNVDGDKALNKDMITLAQNLGWLTAWDYHFYMDTWKKRVMTSRQLTQRRRINKTVLRRLKNPDAESEPEETWDLEVEDIANAFRDGRITEWEKQFYIDNLDRTFVSIRQRPYKRRIEKKVAGTYKPRKPRTPPPRPRSPSPVESVEGSDDERSGNMPSNELETYYSQDKNRHDKRFVHRRGPRRTTGRLLPDLHSIHTARVVAIQHYGAFVQIGDGSYYKDGLIHISNLCRGYVKSVADVVSIGQEVQVEVVQVNDSTSKYSLALQRDD